MEKNKFLKFIFSFVPGAGYMYLNMMVKGTAFMLAFMAVSVLSMGFNFNILIVFLPVLWCYTFFDTFHMGTLSYEDRLGVDTEFKEKIKTSDFKALSNSIQHKKRIVGWIMIFFAIYMLIYNIIYPIFYNFFDYWGVNILMSRIPTLIVVILLLLFGKQMIKAEKKEDFQPYRGIPDEIIIPEVKTEDQDQ